MHRTLIFFIAIAGAVACQVARRGSAEPVVAAAGTGSGDKVKSLAQPSAATDSAVNNALPVWGAQAQNQYGGVDVSGIAGARACAVQVGTAHDCAELTRCAPAAGGRARIDYLEAGVTFDVFVCDADGQAGAARAVVIKGGERLEIEAP